MLYLRILISQKFQSFLKFWMCIRQKDILINISIIFSCICGIEKSCSFPQQMVKIKIGQFKCFTTPALTFTNVYFFILLLRWLLAAPVYIYSIFYSLCRSATVGFIERAFQRRHYTSNCTWKTLAASITCQLQLYRVHLVYNFFSSALATAVSQWAQREDSPTAHTSAIIVSLLFYFQPHTFMDFQFFHQQ